jgi:hypothetical protein
MWLRAIGLMLGALGIRAVASRGSPRAHHPDLGWMSQQWLSEYRAGRR